MPESLCLALKIFIGDEWMTVKDASQTAPDVLHEVLTDAFAIVEEYQLGTVEKSSPEMKFSESGGIHALTALAAAGAQDKNVGLLPSKLPDAELRPVLRLVKSLKPHGDFQFMAEKVRRGKPRPSQR
ncbi:hypothetical protein B0J13DRAFT_531326 [Dactylonectria estremocensis]|uniref:Uncharacterized protein n=1 Tax=Dactylonectria estremocensis TaxID=1079267 RepID=A0A9P9DQX5_9HYPO|nr:hypothetical protein B0J13DRAFT_531326 [Dactylonectria estremocensis]